MFQSQGLSPEFFKNVRLIATDMDGTLTQNGKFTSALLQSLVDLATAGVPVVIVTGRSAGWVNGLVSYLPVAGAIAENGGLFYRGHALGEEAVPEMLVEVADEQVHRRQLEHMFAALRLDFPQLQESVDNAFRVTDWTFDVQGLTPADLQTLGDRCQQQGWDFTYSTVQCHIRLLQQDKAIGLRQVLRQYFPAYHPEQVLTVGDSPNDESLFNPNYFPYSVGVANIQTYLERLTHRPTYLTHAKEAAGFCELATCLLKGR